MVFFTCNSCGSSLKKNQVERHMTSCGRVVSCIDCLKDFRDQEFQAHTKCISEEEKYNGPDWKAPSSRNKGERKQFAWVDTVNAALEKGRQTMTPAQVALMKLIAKHDNVPRKKPKFMNFLKNVARHQFDIRTVEQVWDAIEGEWKSQAEQNIKAVENGAQKPEENGIKSNGTTEQNGKENENGEEESVENGKKNKKKKHKRKRENDDDENGEVKKKKKKKGQELDESAELENENGDSSILTADSTGEFRWGEIIEQILKSRDDKSIKMKKLKKKVFSEYHARVGDSKGAKTNEELTSQLNKKLKKKKFQVVGEIVKLAVNHSE